MGRTRFIAEGRRLMLPSDREVEDHRKEITIGGDLITYRTLEGAEIRVVYVRTWCTPPWKYRVIAVDLDSARLLATTVSQTWERAQERIEDELRDQKLIS